MLELLRKVTLLPDWIAFFKRCVILVHCYGLLPLGLHLPQELYRLIMKFYKIPAFILVLILGTASIVSAQDLPTIESKTAGLEKQEGYVPIYWDANSGKVWLEINIWETDLLYVTSLPAGVGSNDLGLDRGLLGSEYVVQFERVGSRVFMVAPNLQFRATSTNVDEQKAVRDAFASSVVWGFDVAAVTGDRVLVDGTSFMVRDVMGLVRRLKNMGQGNFRLDVKRSGPHVAMTKAFPENTELEARLTFVGDNPGNYVRDVAIDPYAITVRMRQSLVALPELGSYTPRLFDPRSGAYGIEYVDYATPISQPKEVRYLARHRLEKINPDADVSEPVEPIVYYLDRGTPEPIRSALLDGARWWADAFDAAGFRDAYRVEMMPEGADPMDLRYNVIQWVHRATRGWSYGRSIRDPRTGEILKGHVSLGSLRVRQDYLLAEGLLSPYDSAGVPTDADPMLEMALARLRQLSAHEVGHTLGFMHNFAASVNNRASVMDYPAPFVQLNEDGSLSLNEAYDVGIGEWDVVTVKYSYTQFNSDEEEKEGLEQILNDAEKDGYYYISDTDARPQGGAHPIAHLWDNGQDAVEMLELEMDIRQSALQKFGMSSIPEGRPLAQLEEVLVPLYLHHRYQVEAAVKLVGGVDYSYAVRGDARRLPEIIPGVRQLEAVDALLETVTPEALSLPEHIRTQIPPRPPGYGNSRELFDGYTGLVFDPYAPAQTIAQLVFGLLVHPQRAARLVYQNDMNDDLPDLNDVLRRIHNKVWRSSTPRDPYLAELQRITQQVWTDVLLASVTDERVAPAVRARIVFHLRETNAWLERERNRGRRADDIAHRDMIYEDILRVLNRDLQAMEKRRSITTPPGSPIGSGDFDFLQRTTQRQQWLDRWMDQNAFCGS